MNWLSSKLYDPFMRRCEEACLRDWRRNLLSEAGGRVVEVGAGTGANVEMYPEAVDEVVLTEPEKHMRNQLRERLDGRESKRFVVDDRPVEELGSEDGPFDTVVVTLVLCSVDDPTAALRSMREVLRPGGKLIFLEHVASHETGRRRIQGMLEPVWKLCAGNCHLTRRTAEDIEAVGFEFETLEREEMEASLPFLRPSVRGVARRP